MQSCMLVFGHPPAIRLDQGLRDGTDWLIEHAFLPSWCDVPSWDRITGGEKGTLPAIEQCGTKQVFLRIQSSWFFVFVV